MKILSTVAVHNPHRDAFDTFTKLYDAFMKNRNGLFAESDAKDLDADDEWELFGSNDRRAELIESFEKFGRDYDMSPDYLSMAMEILSDLRLHPESAYFDFRRHFVRNYSFGALNAQALSLIAQQGPVVEMGAGTGYNAYLFRQAGIDTVAHDLYPVEEGKNECFRTHKSWSEVLPGDHTILEQYSDRALFISFPTNGPMAFSCLQHYKGGKLIYTRSNNDEALPCADPNFHKALKTDWTLEQEVLMQGWWSTKNEPLRVYSRK